MSPATSAVPAATATGSSPKRSGDDRRVHGDDVDHHQECGNAGPNLGADVRPPFAQVEPALHVWTASSTPPSRLRGGPWANGRDGCYSGPRAREGHLRARATDARRSSGQRRRKKLKTTRQDQRDDQHGAQRDVDRAVLALDRDVARQVPERQPHAHHRQAADDHQHHPDDQDDAADLGDIGLVEEPRLLRSRPRRPERSAPGAASPTRVSCRPREVRASRPICMR